MRLICILMLVACASCSVPGSTISYSIEVPPKAPLAQPFERVLILSDYNVASKRYRDSKEKLFKDIQDTLLQIVSQRVRSQADGQTIVLPGYTSLRPTGDSSIQGLISKNNASHAIVLNSFDVWFDQTRVEVTKTESGKNRQAFYDIVADAEYAVYDSKSIIQKIPVKANRFHSDRSVISGLLAAGPDIIANYKSAYSISRSNVEMFLGNFFPSTRKLSRMVFTSKEFASVGAAMSRNDYEAALIESMKLTETPNRKLAARANYNCAVFMERKGQIAEARRYLRRGLDLHEFPMAVAMLYDMDL